MSVVNHLGVPVLLIASDPKQSFIRAHVLMNLLAFYVLHFQQPLALACITLAASPRRKGTLFDSSQTIDAHKSHHMQAGPIARPLSQRSPHRLVPHIRAPKPGSKLALRCALSLARLFFGRRAHGRPIAGPLWRERERRVGHVRLVRGVHVL